MSGPVVLCYHAVTDDWNDPLAMPPARLRNQVRSLLARRFLPARVDQLLGTSRRLLHVTFDDAFSNVSDAIPILRDLGVPATIFACSSYTDQPRPFAVPEVAPRAVGFESETETMGWSTLRALARENVEIGSHTVTHPHLTLLTDRELADELSLSRERLEDELGRPCRYVAYPYGEHDLRVRRAAEVAGYDAAFALRRTGERRNRYALPRVDLYRRDNLVRATLKTSVLASALGKKHRERPHRGDPLT